MFVANTRCMQMYIICVVWAFSEVHLYSKAKLRMRMYPMVSGDNCRYLQIIPVKLKEHLTAFNEMHTHMLSLRTDNDIIGYE